MNGVDVADQLRSAYNTHLKGVRNWLPLFYWLIDTIKVNSFILWRMHNPNALHKKFQLTLSRELIAEGLEEHRCLLLERKNTSTSTIRDIPGLPPSCIIEKGMHSQVNNLVHCLDYINRKKVLVRKCFICKARTCFHCVLCLNAFCSGAKGCIDKYPCSYTKTK